MKTSEILFKAADVVEERGLTKGWYEDSRGRVCSVGALRTVVFGAPIISGRFGPEEYVALHEALKEMDRDVVKGGYFSVTIWNDAPSRRKHDVARKMRKIAERLVKEGR